jgi:large subunit ribosomal protein L35
MPGKARPGKIKTSSSAKKRIRRTGKGAFVREKASHNHLLQQKSKRQKRLSSKAIKLNSSKKTLKQLLPGS